MADVVNPPDAMKKITRNTHAGGLFALRNGCLSDWERAIVGRVIWAWADVREK